MPWSVSHTRTAASPLDSATLSEGYRVAFRFRCPTPPLLCLNLPDGRRTLLPSRFRAPHGLKFTRKAAKPCDFRELKKVLRAFVPSRETDFLSRRVGRHGSESRDVSRVSQRGLSARSHAGRLSPSLRRNSNLLRNLSVALGGSSLYVPPPMGCRLRLWPSILRNDSRRGVALGGVSDRPT
jgi:hypothetical protein